jgi:glycosyltransferase involved in cell wall biosynthesis
MFADVLSEGTDERGAGTSMNRERPKISVCMAAFQGERFVAAQLRSILDQIAANDEVVVVDDCSSDETRERIRALSDQRIQLSVHRRNQGVLTTFEDALSHATGELIFLSDQDDIWAPGKVSRILQAFESSPEVTLVVTDATLIEENGNQLGASYYQARGRFQSDVFSNLFRSKFLGCTMAFRSGLVPKILPFPRGCGDVVHDFWIGIVNSITAGKTLYIDERLVHYRRHPGAATGGTLTRKRQVKIRLELLRAVLKFWVNHRLNKLVGA